MFSLVVVERRVAVRGNQTKFSEYRLGIQGTSGHQPEDHQGVSKHYMLVLKPSQRLLASIAKSVLLLVVCDATSGFRKSPTTQADKFLQDTFASL